MEKILITFSLLASLVFSSPIFAETLTMDDLVKRDELYYKKFTNIPFTGDILGIVSGKLKMGKKNGEWLYYYGNGQLRALYNYKDAKMEST